MSLLLSISGGTSAVAATGQPVLLASAWWDVRDHAPPAITLVSPALHAFTSNRQQPVVLDVEDPVVWGHLTTLLDKRSVKLLVAGVDVSAQVVIEPKGVAATIPWLPPLKLRATYTPAADAPLPEGVVTFSFSIADLSKNVGTLTFDVNVDTRGPSVSATAPPPGSTFSDTTTPLTFRVEDAGSGVNAASLGVAVNGAARTDGVRLQGADLTISPPAEGWTDGPLAVRVSIADALGNSTVQDFTYTVFSPTLAAYPTATPSSGDAPLRVSFTPRVVTATAIERYDWDFNGDGAFDRSETVGSNQVYTYTQPGTYDAVLRITDTRGVQASGRVRVVVGNRPPVVSAEAAPSNGAPPLQVAFTANAADADGIASYEWDFEGDGTWDVSSASPTASFTYAAAGVFQPRLRVTDALGAATVVAVPSIEVRVAEGAPTVTASASPATGDAPLDVALDATATDPDGLAITEWAWDFDGDGIYDVAFATSAAVTHVYRSPGTYYARVRATASDGGQSVDVVKVVVTMRATLQVSTDTIDTSLGETSRILTSLTGDALVSLVVEDTGGAVVRTLVPPTQRTAGSYTDVWDGGATGGAPLPEGQYRVVLLYQVDGVLQRLDPGLTTGGVQSNPPRSAIPSRFAPFAGRPLTVTYTLSRASEVTAFIGRFNVNTRLVTFLQRVPQGRGSHAIVWNGENSEGQLIHPPAGDAFLFGIFAYTLPDNAIYVRSGVHVSAVAVSPSIFDPAGVAGDGSAAVSSVTFTLNRAGRAELSVYDVETGRLVRRRLSDPFPAGQGALTWDGRNDAGVRVAAGTYRLGVTGVDENATRSATVYALQRVYY